MNTKKIVIILLVVLALVIAAIPVARLIEKNTSGERVRGNDINVVINGKEYTSNNNINYLIMGVDKYENSTDEKAYRNFEQADFLALVSVNSTDETYSILMLNRDSMVDMPEIGITGEPTGTVLHQQLALAHTYGTGAEDSCRNTVDVVSSLLYNTRIDYYVELTMEAISTVNDLIDGVPVLMSSDYTYLDPEFVMGTEVTLRGEQALEFVRARMGADDGTNVARMDRQKTYICAFLDRLAETNINDEFLNNANSKLNNPDIMLTNASLQVLDSLLQEVKGYTLTGLYIPEGEAHVGEEFMEFDINQASLDKIVTTLYYDEK